MKKQIKQIRKTKLKTRAVILIFVVVFSACNENLFGIDENSDINSESSENITGNNDATYAIVGTNQTIFYSTNSEISKPSYGDNFYGQDANYISLNPDYTNNGDGTITDNNTGLMWQKNPGEKMTYEEAVVGESSFNLAGYNDWRLPTIKELYSLIIFSGKDPSGMVKVSASQLIPFIDTDYFDFDYGDESAGERIIDSQFATSTLDVGDSQFGGGNLMFGVNFADGRIKGYPTGAMPGQPQGKLFFVLYIRGNENYGVNSFKDNNDGTITDEATGLMWMEDDSGESMTWQEALEFAEGKEFAGYDDWRLPDIKELQSIVDYMRAPGSINSAAIDPVFNCSSITNEAGQLDYPYFWSSTTHAKMNGGQSAAYISFGRAMGYFNNIWQDVHGAGAQRSDPKIGNPDDYPSGHGPQGDAIRIYNYVRCVRNIDN